MSEEITVRDKNTLDARMSELESKVVALKAQMTEMKEHIIQNFDEKAAAHDRTTQAHIDGIRHSMKLLGGKIDGLDKATTERYNNLQNQIDELKKSMQNQFDDVKASQEVIRGTIADLRKLIEQNRKETIQHMYWLVGTLIALSAVIVAAIKFILGG